MQNLGSFRPLGAILGAPSHTKLDFAIPLLILEFRIYFFSHLLTWIHQRFTVSLMMSWRTLWKWRRLLIERSIGGHFSLYVLGDGHGLVSGGGGSPREDWLHGLVAILHLRLGG